MRHAQTKALAALLALAAFGCEPGQPWFGPRQVDVTPARRRTVAETVEYPARLEAPARVDVVARTEGYLLEQAFEDGSEVEQDQTLFVLQADEYRAATDRARAELARAEAELARAAPDTRAAAEATVNAARASLAQAELEESYTTLRAPIDGRIDRHRVDVGNLVSKGDVLATIVQLDPILVSFEVPADELEELHAAQRDGPIVAVVVTSGGRVHDRTGLVQAIGGEIDAHTGTATTRAVVPNPRTDLSAGQDVTARLVLRWYRDAVVVPVVAVHEHEGQAFVWVVGDDERVERRAVRLGPRSGNERIVLAGLDSGEAVVVGRSRAAVPGRRVRAVVVELPPSPTPALPPGLAAQSAPP